MGPEHRGDRLQALAEKLGCITEEDLALLGNVELETVRSWRHRGKGPKHHKIGARAIYPNIALQTPSGATATMTVGAGAVGLPVIIEASRVLSTGTTATGNRSRSLRAEFMKQHHRPSAGATRGACPGYQVDNREVLICGGRDEPGNLQWLSVEERKAKTQAEVKLCRGDKGANV